MTRPPTMAAYLASGGGGLRLPYQIAPSTATTTTTQDLCAPTEVHHWLLGPVNDRDSHTDNENQERGVTGAGASGTPLRAASRRSPIDRVRPTMPWGDRRWR